MSSSNPSFLIVGAGVFGVSTAFHLIQKYPQASVTIVDRDAYDADSRVAASWDWNKIVRADYDDLVYCQMAIEAQDVFRSDPLWQPYFHETGIFWMCRNSYAQDVIGNYKKLGRKAEISAVSVEEAKKMHNGLFKDADFSGVTEVLINKTSGWAAAGDCLQAVTRRAIELGVKYVKAEVDSLQFDGKGRCIGIGATSGQIIMASRVILCTGAYTAKLLEYSAAKSGIAGLSAGSRIVAGGITTGMATMDDKQFESYASMPVGFQGYPAHLSMPSNPDLSDWTPWLMYQKDPFLGSLPPTPDKELKWWGRTIFRNTTEVLPGRFTSAPPPAQDYKQWKISRRLKDDIRQVKEIFFGTRGKDWKMDKYRICW
jgi:glycine/D-amino acid oxidase-like deaminating enzyme